MTDYKSIAERLRRYWYKGDRDDDQGELLGLLVDEMHDAADAITELLAERDQLRAALEKIANADGFMAKTLSRWAAKALAND